MTKVELEAIDQDRAFRGDNPRFSFRAFRGTDDVTGAGTSCRGRFMYVKDMEMVHFFTLESLARHNVEYRRMQCDARRQRCNRGEGAHKPDG